MRKLLCIAMMLLILCTGCGAAPLQQEALPTEPVTETASEAVRETFSEAPESTPAEKTETVLASAEEIILTDTDGNGTDYTFTYAGETFCAYYTPDNWKIVDSYKITDSAAIVRICTALKDAHPIHSADYESYRTPEDMAYEWEQHNLAYTVLDDSSPWKASAKDVDIDPKDQGKSLSDFYQERMQ